MKNIKNTYEEDYVPLKQKRTKLKSKMNFDDPIKGKKKKKKWKN